MCATIEDMLDHTFDPGTGNRAHFSPRPTWRAELLVPDRHLDPDTAADDADRPGLYAWWGANNIPWPDDMMPPSENKPIYVGIAATRPVGDRIRDNHLRSTRTSALRRSLVALLVDELDLADCVVPLPRPGKFHLTHTGEALLSGWMRENLTVSWTAHAHPAVLERALVGEIVPPLNDVHAHRSPYRARMRSLRAALR